MRFSKIVIVMMVLVVSWLATANEKRSGPVRAAHRALRDNQGEFHALGATMMWALWAYKNDRAWLDRNLQFLSENGFDYIRALGVIDRRIETNPNAYWYRLHMAMNWPDYDQMIAGLTDHVYDKFGMRIEWTIFGGACDFNESQKQELIDKFIRMSRGREQKITHFEVANELHGTCWPGDEGSANLKQWTRYLNDRTDILVAASSPYGEDMCHEMQKIYSGGVADIGTWHFDRDVSKGDGYWRPVRQPWEYPYCTGVPLIGSNNEPIGPGASVASDTDAMTNVGGAIVTYISGLPLHVYHGEFGVRADRGDYTEYHTEVTTAFLAMRKYMPADITNWERHNHHWAGHPFTSQGEVGYPPARGSGAVRNYGATSGRDFVTFPMGIRDYLRMTAKHNMKFCVVHPLTGQTLDRVTLARGESYDVKGAEALFIRGKIDSDTDGCQDYTPKDSVSGLKPGSSLKANQSIKSRNGELELIYQGDGNLVLYHKGAPLWSTGTFNTEPGSVEMQGDGNLVVYKASGEPVWSSGTAGSDGAYLVLEDGGRLVILNREDQELKVIYRGIPPAPVTLKRDQSLKPNESIKTADGEYELIYQGGGNLVLYHKGSALWSTATHDKGAPGSVEMQGDGNLVVYKEGGEPVWSSGTAGNEDAYLVLHFDGKLEVLSVGGSQLKELFRGN